MPITQSCPGVGSTVGSRMRAVVTNGKSAELRSSMTVPRVSPSEVLVEVRAVGLCRTDLYVLSGAIPTRNGRVPGHEFSGVVAATGVEVNDVQIGQRVAVNPLIPCGGCDACKRGHSHDCRFVEFLGIDRDGAFAEFVAVPASMVVPIPDDMPWRVAAFAEPVAASLAVFKASIDREQRGLIYGENRIARLTHRVLQSAGFSGISLCSETTADDQPEGHFDFIVETFATTESLARMVQLLRPRGRIILKSRQYRPVSLVLRDLIAKEPIFEAVHYGRFDQAVEMLARRTIIVDDLIGECYSLDDCERAFAEACSGEREKTFLIPRKG